MQIADGDFGIGNISRKLQKIFSFCRVGITLNRLSCRSGACSLIVGNVFAIGACIWEKTPYPILIGGCVKTMGKQTIPFIPVAQDCFLTGRFFCEAPFVRKSWSTVSTNKDIGIYLPDDIGWAGCRIGRFFNVELFAAFTGGPSVFNLNLDFGSSRQRVPVDLG